MPFENLFPRSHHLESAWTGTADETASARTTAVAGDTTSYRRWWRPPRKKLRRVCHWRPGSRWRQSRSDLPRQHCTLGYTMLRMETARQKSAATASSKTAAKQQRQNAVQGGKKSNNQRQQQTGQKKSGQQREGQHQLHGGAHANSSERTFSGWICGEQRHKAVQCPQHAQDNSGKKEPTKWRLGTLTVKVARNFG